MPSMCFCFGTRWVVDSLKNENIGDVKLLPNMGSKQKNLYKKERIFKKVFLSNRLVLFCFF